MNLQREFEKLRGEVNGLLKRTPRYEEGSWTPTFTGFSVDPVGSYRYIRVGKLCTLFVRMTTGGTTNATAITLSLPMQAAAVGTGWAWMNPLAVTVDNGVTQTTPGRAQIVTGGSVATLFKDTALGAWTNGGVMSVTFQLTYEIA
jgi:hypothetical protein